MYLYPFILLKSQKFTENSERESTQVKNGTEDIKIYNIVT